ncbi:hypothetical protein [Cellulosimicrobium funkei]|uniref:hypothetical protein n=1 Tax=Cellulosimicrobium funkei TaxID=264251 RepID=UPI0037DC6FB8
MDEWLRFVLGLPVVALGLSYFLPGIRWRRRIKADAEVAAALPPGDLRDAFTRRVEVNSQKLLRYREKIVEVPGYWLTWVVIALWVMGTAAGIAWPPWESEAIGGDVAGLIFVGGLWLYLGWQTISVLRGRSLEGHTPDDVEIEEGAIQKAAEEWARRKQAKREKKAARRGRKRSGQ